MAALILNIESSTTNCSISLGEGGKCLDLLEVNDGYSHAEKLAPFVSEILEKRKLNVSSLDAIAVSMGPGSYTGLRIGVSLAKGLCYAGSKPLIAVPTLEAMCLHEQVKQRSTKNEDLLLCPMLDARRMEVYTAVYSTKLNAVLEIQAKILDSTSFAENLSQNKMLFFGNGSNKFKEICSNKNASFADEVWPSAREMCQLSQHRFESQSFEDVAYFEPYYLKDFMATTPKKLL